MVVLRPALGLAVLQAGRPFEEVRRRQLPDAMELVARALRAGHSLAAGMHVVAEEMPAPICKEFGRVYEEQNLGIPLEEALKGMCDRVPNLDLRFFVTCVAIQRQTGGDLAEILDRIGHVIRERFKILGQVKALTAEGRLSGIVLIALPIGLFLMMLYMKPDYIELLWKDPMGIKMSHRRDRPHDDRVATPSRRSSTSRCDGPRRTGPRVDGRSLRHAGRGSRPP